MDRVALVALGVMGALALLVVAWRVGSRRHVLPCPAWLAWLLESRVARPLMDAERTLAPLQLAPGLSVLDAGCGAGRVSLRLAEEVGREGLVLAVDVQRAMLEKVERRAKERGLANVRTQLAELGAGALPVSQFDRAVLATVLGEIPDQERALREILASLKPGGLLAVTEVFPDPHYQSRRSVLQRLEQAGFEIVEQTGGFVCHTTVALRPRPPAAGDR